MSTRVCADRLDCEDGERCNTALAEPACQTIRCETLGTACSEADLCADGLACRANVCREGIDPVALCMDRCERCPSSPGCDDCEGAQAGYDEGRAEAEAAGCLAEFDAVHDCVARGELSCAGDTGCEAEFAASSECFSR